MARLSGGRTGTRARTRLGDMASEAPVAEFARRPGSAGLAARRLPGVLLLVLALVMLRHLLVSPRFVVSSVEVTGTAMLSPDAVREGAGLLGQRIFDVNERRVESVLAGRFACVEAVTVDCRLPSVCRVRVTEVSEVLVWQQGGESWWVGVDGRVLGPATVVTEAPVLRNTGPYLHPEGGYLIGAPWRYALATARALDTGEELEFAPGYGLVVHLSAERLPVYLGSEGDAATKLKLAADALAEAKRRGMGIAYIDLRSGARPIVGGL